MYLGSFNIDDYVGIPAATHRFSSGAAYAPTVLTYSIYEEATAVGIDEDVDMVPATVFDSIVGCYWVRRQLTTAAGFEAGKNYLVVVKATVDSVAAIQMHTFQIGAKANLIPGQLVFKKNVARANFAFPIFDSAGALKTGLTVAAVIRKDAGASFAALAGSVTEIGATGWYTVDWAQAETNADTIAFSASAAGANPTTFTILTQA